MKWTHKIEKAYQTFDGHFHVESAHRKYAYDYKTYVVQGVKTGLIKIGMSAKPLQRLIQLQAGSPDELKLLAVFDAAVEDTLHWRFAFSRAHGEWFYPTKELLDFISKPTF